MQIDKGAAMALADRIRRAMHGDLEDRAGIGNELQGCDRDVREEINKTHTNLIAKEIEAFFA